MEDEPLDMGAAAIDQPKHEAVKVEEPKPVPPAATPSYSPTPASPPTTSTVTPSESALREDLAILAPAESFSRERICDTLPDILNSYITVFIVFSQHA